MRVLTQLQMVVLLSLTVLSSASAGPVIGQPAVLPAENSDDRGSENERRQSERAAALDTSWLFDDIGPLLRVSAPIYLRLDQSAAANSSNESAIAVLQDIAPAGLGAGGGSSPATLGNVGFQLAASTLSTPSGLLSAPTAVPEPPVLLLFAAGTGMLARRAVVSRRVRR